MILICPVTHVLLPHRNIERLFSSSFHKAQNPEWTWYKCKSTSMTEILQLDLEAGVCVLPPGHVMGKVTASMPCSHSPLLPDLISQHLQSISDPLCCGQGYVGVKKIRSSRFLTYICSAQFRPSWYLPRHLRLVVISVQLVLARITVKQNVPFNLSLVQDANNSLLNESSVFQLNYGSMCFKKKCCLVLLVCLKLLTVFITLSDALNVWTHQVALLCVCKSDWRRFVAQDLRNKIISRKWSYRLRM